VKRTKLTFYPKQALLTRVLFYLVVSVFFSGSSYSQKVYDTIMWSTAAAQPFNISEAQGEVVNNKLYSFGGFDATKLPSFTPTKRAYVYDPVANTWSPIADLPFTPSGSNFGGITHAGIATDGTDIFIAGGYTSDAAGTGQIFGTVQAFRYNVGSNTYTALPNLPYATAAAQLEYLDGKLHLIGGTNPARTMDLGDHLVLDLNNLGAGWTTAALLPNPRHHAASAVLGGKIYYIGGQHEHDNDLVTENDVHVYDANSDSWSQVADLPVPAGATGRAHITSASFVANNHIIVIAGETAHQTSTNLVSAYDPNSNTWHNLPPLPANRFSGVAAYMNANLFYTGGSNTNTTYKGIPIRPNALRVNFQDAATLPPAMWLVDYGQSYGPRSSANQGSGNTYGWQRITDGTPLDLSLNGRKRTSPADVLLASFMHMQGNDIANFSGTREAGKWEAVVANGDYLVSVSVGDGTQVDSRHTINIEGTTAISNFTPTTSNRFRNATIPVSVSDGALTIDANGGQNTKINYVIINPVSTGTLQTLSFSPSSLSFDVVQDKTTSPKSADLAANEGTPNVTLSKGANSNWLILPSPDLGMLLLVLTLRDCLQARIRPT
jgi:N-acetylneuraminic acid mutarotase